MFLHVSSSAGMDHEDPRGGCSHLHSMDVGCQAYLPTDKAQAGRQARGAMCSCLYIVHVHAKFSVLS